ncbi:hypothetical protein FPOAC2_12901 [Fusarium poae]
MDNLGFAINVIKGTFSPDGYTDFDDIHYIPFQSLRKPYQTIYTRDRHKKDDQNVFSIFTTLSSILTTLPITHNG